MISNDQELIQLVPDPALKTKREITKYINWQQFTKGTRGKPNEQLFPRQVIIQLPIKPIQFNQRIKGFQFYCKLSAWCTLWTCLFLSSQQETMHPSANMAPAAWYPLDTSLFLSLGPPFLSVGNYAPKCIASAAWCTLDMCLSISCQQETSTKVYGISSIMSSRHVFIPFLSAGFYTPKCMASAA